MQLRTRASEPVDVLAVCTGNLCRSPIIATLLAAATRDLAVRSAGTAAGRSRSWHPLAIEVLAEAGHCVSGMTRRLRAADVRSAHLVLTAEGMHRAAVVRLDPSATQRCFTLLEAARLLELAPAPHRLDAAGLAAHLAVALRNHPQEHDDDLADPILGTPEDFRVCRDAVSDAVARIAAALAGAAPGRQ